MSSWITSTQKDYVFRHHCCPGLRTVLFCFQRCFLRTACHPLLLLLIVFGLSVVSDSDSTECSPPGSSVHGDSPGKNIGVFAMSSSSGSSQPRDQTRLPHCRWMLYGLRRKGSPLLPSGELNRRVEASEKPACFSRPLTLLLTCLDATLTASDCE